MSEHVAAPTTSDVGHASISQAELAAIARAFESTPSVFSTLSTLRTRRIGLGYKTETGRAEVFEWSSGRTVVQPEGPLAFESSGDIVPLSDVETALLAWAGCGPNGLVAADVPVHGALSSLLSRRGRTAPASSNDHSVDLFVIDDDGVWLYRPRPAEPAPVEISGPDDYWKILSWWRDQRILVSERRPDVGWFSAPEGTNAVNPMGPGQYNLNRPGSTWFLPIGDLGLEWFNQLLASYEWSGFYLMDPDTGKSCGVEDFIRPGFLEVGFPIPVFDELILMLHTVQAASIVQNIRLAAEALGLGAWPMGSYADDLVLGAYPDVAEGLGFAFLEREPDRNPTSTATCLGREGVKEAVVVPSARFSTAEAAVDHVIGLRYSPEGLLGPGDAKPFSPDAKSAILDHPKAHIPEWVRLAAIATVEYVVDKYGCCPAFISPVRAKYSVQVHHLDVEWYRRYSAKSGPEGDPFVVTRRIARHFEEWHGAAER